MIKIRPNHCIIFILLIYVIIHLAYGYWRKPDYMINSDVKEYYTYLPAAFIHHDLTLQFKDSDPDFFYNKIWGHQLENGKYVIKVTMGMALIYSPFFLISHFIAGITSWEANGYTNPYAAGLAFSSLLFFIWGLFLLKRILQQYFHDNTISTVIMLIALGTNIIQYVTKEATLTHVYNFFLFAAFIRLTQLWHNHTKLKYALLTGLVAGLISLIRPSNMVVIIIFLLWGVSSTERFKQTFLKFIRFWPHLLAMGTIGVIIWLPQLVYWKYVTGYYFYYSYGEEGFFLLHPKFCKVLFSFRKGWLLYTPVMAFAIGGLVLLLKKQKGLFLPVSVFFIINLYIVSSWWCWWYGGSFGQRVFVDSLALMAIPLAVMTEHFFHRKKKVRTMSLLVAIVLILFNLFQWLKYTNTAIHWDSMSKDAYAETFFRLHPTQDFFMNIIPPDYANAIRGLPERTTSLKDKRKRQDDLFRSFHDTAEISTLDNPMGISVTSAKNDQIHAFIYKTAGNPFLSTGRLDEDNHYIPGFEVPLNDLKQQGVSRIVAAYLLRPDDTHNIEHIGIVISVKESDTGTPVYYHFEPSVSATAKKGQWHLFHFEVFIGDIQDKNCILSFYLWNIEGKAGAEVNDFRVYGLFK